MTSGPGDGCGAVRAGYAGDGAAGNERPTRFRWCSAATRSRAWSGGPGDGSRGDWQQIPFERVRLLAASSPSPPRPSLGEREAPRWPEPMRPATARHDRPCRSSPARCRRVNANAAGIDVGAASHFVAVPGRPRRRAGAGVRHVHRSTSIGWPTGCARAGRDRGDGGHGRVWKPVVRHEAPLTVRG